MNGVDGVDRRQPSQTQNPRSLDRSVAAQHYRPDPRKRTLGGRHQIGIPAGFRSELVAGFLLELVAGFVGIRRLDQGYALSLAEEPAEPRRGGEGLDRQVGGGQPGHRAGNGNVQAAKCKAKGYRTKHNLKLRSTSSQAEYWTLYPFETATSRTEPFSIL